MKKTIAITTAIALLICFSTVSAHADRKTMEGFMLGTGVAILTAAIYNGVHRDSKPHYTRHYSRHDGYHHAGYRHGYKNKHHRKFKSHRPRGHWEVERIWIEPVYEKKWNPGHYNPRGSWVSGRHERFLVGDGYWHEEKVWIRY